MKFTLDHLELSGTPRDDDPIAVHQKELGQGFYAKEAGNGILESRMTFPGSDHLAT